MWQTLEENDPERKKNKLREQHITTKNQEKKNKGKIRGKPKHKGPSR